jgi:hypothetical protein
MILKKIYSVLALLMISMLAFSGLAAAAAEITFHDVKLDGDQLMSGTNIIQDVAKGDELEVRVRLEANESLANVEVRAELAGYDHSDRVSDVSDVFDMKANVAYTKKLSLDFPIRMDQDGYKLMIDIRNRDGQIDHQEFDLEIDSERNSLEIKDVILSPENEVKAGRSLLVSVRLKNRGELREEDVKIKVSVPELGISQSEYVDDIDAECSDNNDNDCDDSLTSEEIFLRIPSDAVTGEYSVNVEVEYDDGDEEVSETTYILVEGEEATADAAEEEIAKTVITVGADVQTATVGGAAVVYPITLTNQGTESKSYSVSADGEWATFTITPSNVVVLSAGESKAVYVYVTANDNAAAGEQMFSIDIVSGDKTLKQIPLKANVEAGNSSSFDKVKRGLEVGLVVLVVLLVILGLIIGFNKLKGSDDDEDKDEEGQTYY